MFERFTERARQVVVFAQEEARSLRHNYIGTEHILLGLLREQDGLAARALHSLGIALEPAREQVVRIVELGEEAVSGQVPFTPRSKRVLAHALNEAQGLGGNYIGTEHILLGLVRDSESVASRILLDFEADTETIRDRVTHMIAEGRAAGSGDAPQSRFEFNAAVALDLATRLAPLARRITLDVCNHEAEEPVFRVSCELASGEGVLRDLVALERDGIRAIIDGQRSVKLLHSGSLADAGPASEQ
jgi:ATP-dependent Clp protease ATP-binding subunit ClpA